MIDPQSPAARARLAAVRGTGTSPDGAVTASVNVQGALADLRLGPAAATMAPDALAGAILAASRLARDSAARAASDALAPATPSPAARPALDEDDEAGYTRGG